MPSTPPTSGPGPPGSVGPRLRTVQYLPHRPARRVPGPVGIRRVEPRPGERYSDDSLPMMLLGLQFQTRHYLLHRPNQSPKMISLILNLSVPIGAWISATS